jgi:methyl-accepting chemotaxis protein
MLNVAAGKLEEAGVRAVRSLEASMENNASGGTRQALSERSSELAAAVGALAAAGRAAQPGQGLDAASTAFMTELGATWRATEGELSRLLDVRVAEMRAQMLSQLALIATFLISAGALAWLVASGLAKRFKALTAAMDRLRSGEMDVEIPHSDDRCETGKIAETLDALRQAIIERERNAEAKAGDQTRVVQSLALALKRLSDGDLTCRIHESFPKEYEQLRADFNAAMENLLSAMKMIIANASGIRTGAGEISQAADDLSRRTEQQAASLEQTVAALDEITATVRKTAEGSNQANAVVGGARGDAEASGEVVREAVAAMSEIEKSAKQISQIIGVIDEIAFQTNLLALNAGVEAARAGDAGRGFAVVASEVRALAQRSSEAAKEIKGLISASTQHVETGVELVGQAGQALQLIVDKVGEINGLIGRIAASAQEQATGLSQVNAAINQMDQVTQQNAAMVEQSTAASHALTQEAEELMRLISRFSTGESAPSAAQLQPLREGVPAQRKRVAAFAATRGNAALKLEAERDDEWQEF